MQTKLKKILLMLLVMLSLIALLTAIMTWVNLPSSQDFMITWLSAFTYAFLILLPIGSAIFTVLNKLINQFCTTYSSLQKNLLHGVLMVVIMETLMAVVTILNNQNHGSFSEFNRFFFNSLLYAIPIGLSFSCFMALALKPKLESYLTNTAV